MNFAQADQQFHSQDEEQIIHTPQHDGVLYSTPKKATVSTTTTPTLTPSRNAAALARKAFILASQDIFAPLKESNNTDHRATSRQLLVNNNNNNSPIAGTTICTSTGKNLAVAWYVKKKDDKAMIEKKKGSTSVYGYNKEKKSSKYCYNSCKEN